MYELVFFKKVIKTLININEPYYSAIKEAIQNLAQNPRPFGYKKLKGKTTYRIRVGDYRVIYDIKKEILVVEIIDVGHRKNIYM